LERRRKRERRMMERRCAGWYRETLLFLILVVRKELTKAMSRFLIVAKAVIKFKAWKGVRGRPSRKPVVWV
jgi:hypothetical protein